MERDSRSGEPDGETCESAAADGKANNTLVGAHKKCGDTPSY